MSASNTGERPVTAVPVTRPAPKPVRKDEIVLEEQGLYIESWLPERRSRRKPLYLVHGELAGSWLWVRYLQYFAQRGWEAHALNLRGHFWSDTADFDGLPFESYVDDVVAGSDRLARPAVVIGHGMGALLALKAAETRPPAALVLLSPELPAALLPEAPPRIRRPTSGHYRRQDVNWHLPVAELQRLNPDLTIDDVARVQHLMGAGSVVAREAIREGIAVDNAALAGIPMLVIGAGLDRERPESHTERLAEWLGADHAAFGAHSHYGLVIGERSFEQVAEVVRGFLEIHRL